MIIKLSPITKHEPTTPPVISLSVLTLTVGETVIDLSQIPDGGSAEWDDPTVVIGTITRDFIEIAYPYSTHEYESMQSTNPADYEIELLDEQTLQCPLIKRPVQVVDEVSEDLTNSDVPAEEPTGEQP